MTAIAALVAEATEAAAKATPDDTTPKGKGTARFVRTDGWKLAEQAVTRGLFDTHIRLDMHDAALAHLATRAAEAEGRAERAEAERDAVARQGWRACVLLAAARLRTEADQTYADADEAYASDRDDLVQSLHDEAGELEEAARRPRAFVEEDAEKDAPRG